MSAQEANAFYNQAFDTLSNMKLPNGKTVIDKKAVAGNIIQSPLLGGNKINMQARKEAVDKAIYQHPEAGELLRQQYEFDFDPRGVQEQAQQTRQLPNVNFAPWNSTNPQYGMPSSSYTPDLDEDEYDDDLLNGYDGDLSGISI